MIDLLKLMSGIDIPIPELQLVMHQPQIREIGFMGEDSFFSALHYLCLNKEELIQDNSISKELSNFQVLMKVLQQSKDKDKKQSITTLLSLLFNNYSAFFTPNSIILKSEDTTVLIDEYNFNELQLYLKQVFCVNNLFQQNHVQYNIGKSKSAKRILDKIMSGRKKIAAQKQQKQESILTKYISILTIGLQSMSLNDCLNLTLFQLFDLIERYSLKFHWDLDIKQRLAGGKPNKEAEDWMKNIH